MKRFVGAVSGALRGLIPRTTATAAPNAVHQEQVRKAMESLAPKGRMLPSESKALAMEITSAEAAGSTGDQSHKTPEEMHLAANAFHQGTHVPQDKVKAFELWKQAADAGHPKATYSYAGCLRNGEGTERDLLKAVELFQRLGDQGLLEAKHALGLVLSSGEGSSVGVAQDETRARELFREAAVGGFIPAIHAAASMMEAGQGGDKEEAKAAQWLEVAIEAGDPMAASTLATWYQDGRGGKAVDHEKAYELHVNAAARGMPRAQYNTAVQLFEGKGVEQNLAEAAKWFERAAVAGVPQAMLNLGKMLEEGLGVEQDRERALKLYQSAVRAEGNLEGEVAKLGDEAVAKLFKAKGRGAFRRKEGGPGDEGEDTKRRDGTAQ